jgi:hypothetical protein
MIMALAPRVLDRSDVERAREAIMERYTQQAAWHQRRALASLARAQEIPSGSVAPGQRTDLLLAALTEAISAWRLLQHAREEASSRAAATRVGTHLGKVYALAESIERELYNA